MIKKKFQLYLLMYVFLFVSFGVFSEAGFTDGQCVTAEIQGISPSSVGIDEEFTLGINLESCGEDIPKSVTFAIKEIPSDIIVNEDLVRSIPELFYGTSERYIRYHMRTTSDANPGPHIIRMELIYGDDNAKTKKDLEIEVFIIGEDAEPRISSVSSKPDYIYEGDSVDLILDLENYGEAIAKSVIVSLDHDFKGIKDATIGTLGLNGSKTAFFRLKAEKTGSFRIPVLIEYEDDLGTHKVENEIWLNILDKKGSINLASVRIDPVLPHIGDTIELTLRVENFRDRTINSIKVLTDHPFKGIKESFIGTLEPNEDGPAVVTFVADHAGEYEIPVVITYTDDFGEESIQTSISLIVLEKDSNAGKVAIMIIILGIIGGLIYYNFSIRTSKDRIIKQLMRGAEDASGRKK